MLTDMEEDLGVDIDDLEARLYGQVYHSVPEEENMEPKKTFDNTQVRESNKKVTRYFENPDLHRTPQAYQPSRFAYLENVNRLQPDRTNQNERRQRKQSNTSQYKSNNDQNNPQHNPSLTPYDCQGYIMPGASSSNYRFPSSTSKHFSSAFHSFLEKENKTYTNYVPSNLTQTLFKEHRLQHKEINEVTSKVDVVILSDSNESDVEEIIEKVPVIDISDGDENLEEVLVVNEDHGGDSSQNKKNSNDNTFDEIKNDDNEKTEVATEKHKNPNNKITKTVKQIKQEKDSLGYVQKVNEKVKDNTTNNIVDDVIVMEEKVQEIIDVDINTGEQSTMNYSPISSSTDDFVKITENTDEPNDKNVEVTDENMVDSTNDFLDNFELNQDNFDFQLHGKDFFCSKGSNQTKNMSSNEAYETESSCSTVDIPIRSNITLLNFDSPCKQAFEEPNLESFADFITPKRNICNLPISEEVTKQKRKKSKSPKVKRVTRDNEKEIKSKDEEPVVEGEKKTKKKKKSKSLEEIELEERRQEGEELSKKKKKKKSSNDLLEDRAEATNLENEEVKTKKRKKKSGMCKKRKEKLGIESNKKQINSGEKEKFDQKVIPVGQSLDNIQVAASDSENSVYTVEYDESDNDSNSRLSFCTILDVETKETEQTIKRGNDKKEKYISDFLLDDLSDISDDVEVVNVELKRDKCSKQVQNERIERKQFSHYWTNDMEKFYSESWGHENFSVSEAQQSMSDDPMLWEIMDRDKYMFFDSRGPRCRWCKQRGHKGHYCPNKSKNPVCSLCGEKDHWEPRCPNKLCTSCGQKINYSTTYCSNCKGFRNVTCNICNMKGHLTKSCPDLWRRYHLTTEEGPLVRPEKNVSKPPTKRWCSGCGSQGHYEYDCKYYNRTHSATLLAIQRYDSIDTKTTSKRKNQNDQTGSPKDKQLKKQHDFFQEQQKSMNSNKASSLKPNDLRNKIEEFRKSGKSEEKATQSPKETKSQRKRREKKQRKKELEKERAKNLGQGILGEAPIDSRYFINPWANVYPSSIVNNQQVLLQHQLLETIRNINPYARYLPNNLKMMLEQNLQNIIAGNNQFYPQQMQQQQQYVPIPPLLSPSMQPPQPNNIFQEGNNVTGTTKTVQTKAGQSKRKQRKKRRFDSQQTNTRRFADQQEVRINPREGQQVMSARFGNKQTKEDSLNVQKTVTRSQPINVRQPEGQRISVNESKSQQMSDRSDNQQRSVSNSEEPHISVSQSKDYQMDTSQCKYPQVDVNQSKNEQMIVHQSEVQQIGASLLESEPISVSHSEGQQISASYLEGQRMNDIYTEGQQISVSHSESQQMSGSRLESQQISVIHSDGQQMSASCSDGQQMSTSYSEGQQMNVNTSEIQKMNLNPCEGQQVMISKGLEGQQMESDGRKTSIIEADSTSRNMDLTDDRKNKKQEFIINLAYYDIVSLKSANGKIFLSDLSAAYGFSYWYYLERNEICISGDIDADILRRIKNEVMDFTKQLKEVQGFLPLPKTHKRIHMVLTEQFEKLKHLPPLSNLYKTILKNKFHKMKEFQLRVIRQNIVLLNRFFLGIAQLRGGKKHVNLLVSYLNSYSNSNKLINENEWEKLNTSYNYIFQNDFDDLLSINSLRKISKHAIHQRIYDETWKPLEDKNILQNLPQYGISSILNCPPLVVEKIIHLLNSLQLLHQDNAVKNMSIWNTAKKPGKRRWKNGSG